LPQQAHIQQLHALQLAHSSLKWGQQAKTPADTVRRIGTTQATFTSVDAAGGLQRYTLERSQLMESLLLRSARSCLDEDDQSSCRAVANLCVLQMHQM
jgi:hypothetical protein